MRKISFLFLALAFFAMASNKAAWAHSSSNYFYGYGYFPDGYSFGLGTTLGYPYYGYGGYRNRFYGNFSFGYPYYYRPYYRPYYYGGYMQFPYSPSVIVVPSSPPVYIQQPSTTQSAPTPETNYWYYCEEPAGYYPYVKKCPGGWIKVAPQPTE